MPETPDPDDSAQNPDAEIQEVEEDLKVLREGADVEAEGPETTETEQAADTGTPVAGVESSAGPESGPGRLISSPVGQIIGSINETRSSRDVVREMVEDFAAAVERLSGLLEESDRPPLQATSATSSAPPRCRR